MDEKITIRHSSGTYTFPTLDDHVLGEIATGILSHLGASFEIRWPDEADKEACRDYGRSLRRKRDEEADARGAQGGNDPLAVEALRDAYVAGWNASPKPMRYWR